MVVNIKRWIAASIVVFVAMAIMEWLIHGILLKGLYEAAPHLWRSCEAMCDLTAKPFWAFLIGGALYSLMFCFIFAKGFEGRAWEGFRYGVYIWLFNVAAWSFIVYAIQPVGQLPLWWIVFGLPEFLILGLIAALIYKKE